MVPRSASSALSPGSSRSTGPGLCPPGTRLCLFLTAHFTDESVGAPGHKFVTCPGSHDQHVTQVGLEAWCVRVQSLLPGASAVVDHHSRRSPRLGRPHRTRPGWPPGSVRWSGSHWPLVAPGPPCTVLSQSWHSGTVTLLFSFARQAPPAAFRSQSPLLLLGDNLVYFLPGTDSSL